MCLHAVQGYREFWVTAALALEGKPLAYLYDMLQPLELEAEALENPDEKFDPIDEEEVSYYFLFCIKFSLKEEIFFNKTFPEEHFKSFSFLKSTILKMIFQKNKRKLINIDDILKYLCLKTLIKHHFFCDNIVEVFQKQ